MLRLPCITQIACLRTPGGGHIPYYSAIADAVANFCPHLGPWRWTHRSDLVGGRLLSLKGGTWDGTKVVAWVSAKSPGVRRKH